MENSGSNPGNKAMPQYPKASDELQKHIETVIPDEEQEDSPTANAAPEESGATRREEGAVKPIVSEARKADGEAEKDEDEKPQKEI
ncbi:MAG: hypothetical protein REI78_04955 [Pedobacter sp.]|nr:hypothetical protein [Pedobacter sp.]